MINHVFISFSAVQIHVYYLSYIHFHAYHYWVFIVIKGSMVHVSNESIVSIVCNNFVSVTVLS